MKATVDILDQGEFYKRITVDVPETEIHLCEVCKKTTNKQDRLIHRAVMQSMSGDPHWTNWILVETIPDPPQDNQIRGMTKGFFLP